MTRIHRVLTTPYRQIGLFLAYTTGLAFSVVLAFLLRFDFNVPPEYYPHAAQIILILVAPKLLLLLSSGQFGTLLSYFGLHDVAKLLGVCLVSAAIGLGFRFAYGVPFTAPRAVIIADLLIAFLFLCGFRLSLRLLREGYFDRRTDSRTHKRVAVIGAGDVGASLVRDFQAKRGLGMKPLVFFDDDRDKWGTTIHGVGVHGAPESLTDYIYRSAIDEVVIAMPSASGRRVREIVALLHKLHLRFEIVPSYEQLVTGRVRVSEIRSVEIQDLLGREAVNLSTDSIRQLISNRVVLISGAGGSIGSELCRQVARYEPALVLLVERSEFLLFQTEQEILGLGTGIRLVPLVADILDESRLRGIFQRYQPSIVFHAAAHKHVPLMESQPWEAFRNNVLGTRLLAETAIASKTERFILISTDKAINPTSVMGVTKRIAELYLQALQKEAHGSTRFLAVRFGNVLGSSGSVIPTFRKQIAAGGPVTVTHPDVTRYFMTVSEAVGLVLQCATQGEGGEIFVLDMGQPMKIADLARQLIELSGLTPDVDIEVKFTGLRPGEKLFEELNHNSENLVTTAHPKVWRFIGQPQALAQLQAGLEKCSAHQCPDAEFKALLRTLVPEYTPYVGPG